MRLGAPAARGGRRADLHTHTIYSDGTLTPAELVARARDHGLAAVAITDHDSVEGLALALPAAGNGLELVPGVEISTAGDGLDLHILGLYVDPVAGDFCFDRNGDACCRTALAFRSGGACRASILHVGFVVAVRGT